MSIAGMDQLIEAYRKHKVILFVGGGVSMNLGLPSWRQLVDHMAAELGYDPEEYRSYGNDFTLAEYYRLKKGKIGPLRSWMDRIWHQNKIDIGSSRIHEIIAKSRFDLIYTTNYDRWLEIAFDHFGRDYVKILNVGDLAQIRDGAVQLIKFHGDFDDDTSIVLDESSYFERLEFEFPLDIKLRSDVLGRSVLFIGYSLSDIHVRYLFYKLANLWKKNASAHAQPKSYIFSPRPNPVQEAVLSQWNIEMISSREADPQKALVTFLEKLTADDGPAEGNTEERRDKSAQEESSSPQPLRLRQG